MDPGEGPASEGPGLVVHPYCCPGDEKSAGPTVQSAKKAGLQLDPVL